MVGLNAHQRVERCKQTLWRCAGPLALLPRLGTEGNLYNPANVRRMTIAYEVREAPTSNRHAAEYYPPLIPPIIAIRYRRYREPIPPAFSIDTGDAHALFETGPQLPPHVHLAHVDPCGAVDDAVHDGVGAGAAAEPGVPALLPELCAEDRGGRAVTSLHELGQEAPEELVRPVEQPLVEHEHLEGCVRAITVADSPDALSLSIPLAGILLAMPDASLSRWNAWRRERSAGAMPRGGGICGRCRSGIPVVSKGNIGVSARWYRFALHPVPKRTITHCGATEAAPQPARRQTSKGRHRRKSSNLPSPPLEKLGALRARSSRSPKVSRDGAPSHFADSVLLSDLSPKLTAPETAPDTVSSKRTAGNSRNMGMSGVFCTTVSHAAATK